jgi:chromosome segregation ATPase
MTALEAQNRALAEQNRAAMAEIANLRSHARTVEDQLQTAEQDLAASEDRAGLQGQQLANYRREREELHEQFRGVAQLLSRRGAETPANPY